jgi:hypothetical protein
MNFLATWKIVVATLAMLAGSCWAVNEFDQVDGPNVRVMRHEDGSRTIFLRSPDNRTMTKKTFNANGALSLLTIYRMDSNGNPLGCKIMDGTKTELFKVSYGYRKSDGLLVEERMFDSRVRRLNPENGSEMPVQRVIYLYDAQGKRSAPIALNLLPGRTFEEVYGSAGSAYERNPFDDEAKPANPNARPLKR